MYDYLDKRKGVFKKSRSELRWEVQALFEADRHCGVYCMQSKEKIFFLAFKAFSKTVKQTFWLMELLYAIKRVVHRIIRTLYVKKSKALNQEI